MVREKSIFLAGQRGGNSLQQLLGQNILWGVAHLLANKRVWEAHRSSGAGVVRDLEQAECSLFYSCLELGEWYPDCIWAADAREVC